jgi:hypothetical protein
MLTMIDHADWTRRLEQLRAAGDADQIEKRAIELGAVNIEEGIRDQLIADAMDDFVEVIGEPWVQDDSKIEDGAGQSANELVRRAEILREYYPFRLNGNHLTYLRSKTLIYEFCLAVASAPTITKGHYVALPRAFERLSRDVASIFLGDLSDGYRTGAPSDVDEGKPSRMKEVAADLHRLTGEWHWQPRAGLPPDPDPRDAKDLGIDVVSWKRFGDSRRGSLFLVGQCACGGPHDWPAKFGQLNLDKLSINWFHPLSFAPANRFFAVPFHIPNSTHLEEITSEAGLTFDRARITLLAESDVEKIKSNSFDDYCKLIKLVIADFEAD